MKLSAFIAQASNISASLIRSTVRQMGGWEEFKAHAADVTNHGAAGGFRGFCYYTETVAFTQRNRKAILAMAEEMGQELGEGGAIGCIASFQCLKGNYTQAEIAEAVYNYRSENRTQVYNALAWYALEEVCRAYMDAALPMGY
jgi:hypothetical protein